MDASRRKILKGLSASLLLSGFPSFAVVNAVTQSRNSHSANKKVVWVCLRGALDGLHTVIPHNEKQLGELRPTLFNDSLKGCFPLNSAFSLNGALPTLASWYQQKQLLPVIAVGSGYKGRSHFDGQDFLESGLPVIDAESGWLARAISGNSHNAVAISQRIPLSLRKTDKASSWYPSRLEAADNELISQLHRMYANDNALSMTLKNALSVKEMAGDIKVKGKHKFVELAKAAGTLLKEDNGLTVATLELGGWDTHNNQTPRLKRMLSQLDKGLLALKQSLDEEWENTLVVIASEFGRTAKENGTKGTDHGTGNVLLFAGGSLKGGHVLGEWPGLSANQLFEGRDLKPTSNILSWIATGLSQHWHLSNEQLKTVFPSAQIYSSRII
ncbi:DUF1501 domain-containing protein [Thalassotalea euphylliae]|uniref:DUF1501 domain-containing protein n=1 Tax=Thalassotalea euphylliae TaxID=1655234 RepID=UPI0036419879